MKRTYRGATPLLLDELTIWVSEAGEGTPIIILHGLMGGLSNFDAVTDFFSNQGFKVVIPIFIPWM